MSTVSKRLIIDLEKDTVEDVRKKVSEAKDEDWLTLDSSSVLGDTDNLRIILDVLSSHLINIDREYEFE